MALPEIKVRVSADTTAAEAGLKRVGSAVTQVQGKGVAATGTTKKMSGALKSLGNVSNSTRAKIQQTSFQLQDIIVQLQMGTSVSRTLGQQLPQLAGAFGAVGAAIGVGVGLAIPALSMAFNALRGESVDLEDAMDELTESVGRFDTVASSLQVEVLPDLAEKYGDLTDQVLRLGAAQQEVAFVRARDALNETAEAVKELGIEYGAVAYILDTQFRLDPKPVRELAADLNITRDAAEMLGLQFKALEEIEGAEAQARQYAFIRDLIVTLTADQGELNGRALDMVEALNAAEQAALDFAAVDMATPISDAANEAARLNQNLQLFQAQMNASQLVGGGRGGDPRDFEEDAVFVPLEEGGRKGGGGRGAQDREARKLETLIDSLKTQQETVDEWRSEGLARLQEANETELAELGGFNEAKLRLEEEYQKRVANIKKRGRLDDLKDQLGAGEGLLQAIGQHNEKALKLSKVFGAAEALVSTYQGAAEALKLPFPANLAAMASVMAAGLGLVSSIQGVVKGSTSSSGGRGRGGGGGGGVGAAPAEAANTADSPLLARLNVSFDMSDPEKMGRFMTDMINRVSENGSRRVRLV